MSYYFWKLVSYVARAILLLRYSVKITGLEHLNPKELNRKEGILFLPNHPAHMDPLMLYLLLWPKYRMRPLVIEYIYRLAILGPFMKLVKAISIPNFDTSVNQLKLKKADEAVALIGKGLNKKENFILYPGGRLKRTGKEILGGASGAYALMQQCPDCNVVLIRTTGLWGSSFSRAILGRSPDLPKTLFRGIKTILKNLIFFSPRRKVTIEIEVNPAALPRTADKLTFNRFLENWYNQYRDDNGKMHETEPAKLVSYSLWRKELLPVYQPKKKGSLEGGNAVSSETRDKVYKEIRRILDKPTVELHPDMNLAIDLGMDSLNILEMIAFLSNTYDAGEIHPEDLETIQSLLEIAEGARATHTPTHSIVQVSWPQEKGRPEPMPPLGRTSQEAFLNICQRMGSFAACGDDLVGVLSYKRLRLAVLALAQYFKTLPESKVAVLLPASCGAYITILALQFAGKVPVMLNWTLGPRYLEEMMRLSGAKRVISSWRFLDRLSHVDFGNLIEGMELLEDIRKEKLTLKKKLAAAFYSHCPSSYILRAHHLHKIDENSPAVILFTSGTEASPKGVPLSHKNILSNQRSAIQCIDVYASDVIYGILPPFHSFGYSIAGFFPMFIGMRLAFYPDPTDSFALSEGIHRWKVTIFCSAPSFLRGLLQAAKKEQLKTVRYFVTGAEKVSQELIGKVAGLGTKGRVLEGYGITECAPVLTLTRPNLPLKGVGQLIPDIEFCTIHPETLALLPHPSDEGEICVRGPNVFHGYLGNPRSPFIEIEGKKWYRTGDIGYLDAEGNLILSGRLKRFTKVGGEMISLGAVEEVLVKDLLAKGKISTELPSIAICADERNADKSQLILFTTVPIDRDSANEILGRSGFSRLIKISSVQKLDEIPMMGTGKTDYRKLQTLLK